MLENINIGVVGVTGLVGRTMLEVLIERNFPANIVRGFASAKSAGNKIDFRNDKIIVEELKENSFEGLDICLFSAGAYVSEKFAPIAVKAGCKVIDNGSYWRMNPNVPLIVPEVNANDLTKHNGIIANPNCSTIQLVVAINALAQLYPLKRLVISTYQAISGAGQKGLDKYQSEMQGKPNADEYKIFNSVMFHSKFNERGNTVEEEKMENEIRKILHLPTLPISATCVRIPVENSHCESINVEFAEPLAHSAIKRMKEKLSSAEGIIFVDDKESAYPTPLLANGRNDVFVGRLRTDNSCPNAINMWVVADNLRKGAATNAVQIAEKLIST